MAMAELVEVVGAEVKQVKVPMVVMEVVVLVMLWEIEQQLRMHYHHRLHRH